MKLMFKLALVFCTLVGSAVAATPDDARKSLDAACPGLKTHADDLKFQAPVKGPASLDAQRDRKWSEAYSIVVRVNDQTSSARISQYRAQGHACYFEVEASKASEVSVMKSPCQSICKNKAYGSGYVAYFGVNGSEELRR